MRRKEVLLVAFDEGEDRTVYVAHKNRAVLRYCLQRLKQDEKRVWNARRDKDRQFLMPYVFNVHKGDKETVQ